MDTAFTIPSGQGTSMFSKPGASTIAEYLCFKEPHEVIQEKDEFVMQEEDKQQQVINDINA